MPSHPHLLTKVQPAKLQEHLKKQAVPTTFLLSTNRIRQNGLIYGIYRLLAALFLLASDYATGEPIFNGSIFGAIIGYLVSDFAALMLSIYLILSIVLLGVLYHFKKYIYRQVIAGLFIDMVLLTLLLYSSTARDLQIVVLYTITTAFCFMMVRLPHAFIITFIAILSLILQQSYYAYTGLTGVFSLYDTVMLSGGLVAVGFLSWSVSQRLVIAEKLAFENAKEITQLNTINQEVIREMVNGLLIFGTNDRLLLINEAASTLLRLPTSKQDTDASLFEIERELGIHHKSFVDWYRYTKNSPIFYLNLPQFEDLPPKSIRISKKYLPNGKLLILEDVNREENHAHQLKLASLGQLSASIAHEIRNPLGVISQASELLIESGDTIGQDNQELCQMIYQQTKRVNRIIEDIMKLSRQESPIQEPLDLAEWLPDFLAQYYADKSVAASYHAPCRILFDPHHLEQIFINLINNALRHTKPVAGRDDVHIKIHGENETVYIDILDNGNGVSQNDIPNLFQPFFTKNVGGTGLGLYLSQSFSRANQAQLIYIDSKKQTCFRLIAPSY